MELQVAGDQLPLECSADLIAEAVVLVDREVDLLGLVVDIPPTSFVAVPAWTKGLPVAVSAVIAA
jgi:hypothetical protein